MPKLPLHNDQLIKIDKHWSLICTMPVCLWHTCLCFCLVSVLLTYFDCVFFLCCIPWKTGVILHSYLPRTVTSLHQSPSYTSHLPTPVTFLHQSPPYTSHLPTPVTFLYQPPPYTSHLPTPATSLHQPLFSVPKVAVMERFNCTHLAKYYKKEKEICAGLMGHLTNTMVLLDDIRPNEHSCTVK